MSAAASLLLLFLSIPLARAEIDGHGPDAWRVTNVSADDVLNARMGPGTNFPVIETFAYDERGLQLVTCVPFYTMKHFSRMTEAEIEALPNPWCLMRSADLIKTGWVAQNYLMPDHGQAVSSSSAGEKMDDGKDMVAQASDLIRRLYEAADPAGSVVGHPLDPAHARDYFSTELVNHILSQPVQVDPIYGAQDFSGSVSEPKADPDQPMLRGMITIHVDIVNFGRSHTATFRLRADPSQPGAPVRIFRVEHDGWSFP
ncbi:hypothetical protein [Nitratireductor sp. CH_MIT9313-5]|uniref:hypothetical protein n=1 Tax=Nitratireductor sp. CH_MIT9313-5 TaxID=3107764 RepID=UPI003008E3BF